MDQYAWRYSCHLPLGSENGVDEGGLLTLKNIYICVNLVTHYFYYTVNEGNEKIYIAPS